MKTEKRCPKCLAVKPVAYYYKDKSSSDGFSGYCGMCMKERADKWRNANREKYLEYSKKARLKINFGITSEEYDAMLKAQGGICKICGDAPGKQKYAFHVDHCHTTGRVRGILCAHCNRGLGAFRDNQEYLQEAINYLRGDDE